MQLQLNNSTSIYPSVMDMSSEARILRNYFDRRRQFWQDIKPKKLEKIENRKLSFKVHPLKIKL